MKKQLSNWTVLILLGSGAFMMSAPLEERSQATRPLAWQMPNEIEGGLHLESQKTKGAKTTAVYRDLGGLEVRVRLYPAVSEAQAPKRLHDASEASPAFTREFKKLKKQQLAAFSKGRFVQQMEVQVLKQKMGPVGVRATLEGYRDGEKQIAELLLFVADNQFVVIDYEYPKEDFIRNNGKWVSIINAIRWPMVNPPTAKPAVKEQKAEHR